MRSRYRATTALLCGACLWMAQSEATAGKWDDLVSLFTRGAVKGVAKVPRYLNDDGKTPTGIRELYPLDDMEQSGTQTPTGNMGHGERPHRKQSQSYVMDQGGNQTAGDGEDLLLVLGGILLAVAAYLFSTDPDVRAWLKGTRRR